MINREPTMTDQKLTLLYALDQLGQLTALQLLRFLVENDLMDYIAFRLSLSELDETQLLRKATHALGTLYAPSAEGYAALALFGGRLPHSRRAHIEELAQTWRLRFREEKQVLADWTQTVTGEYAVHLRLMEQELPLLEMTVSLPTREQANTFCARWSGQATDIYAGLMRALGEGEDPEPGISAQDVL